MKKIKVLMIVLNNVIYDPRVIREAQSLQNANFQLEILGIKQKKNDRNRFYINDIKIRLVKILTKEILPKNTLGWLVKYVELCIRLNIKLLFNNFQIVHAHNLDALFPIFFQSKLFRKKIIYDSHELFTEMAGKNNNIVNKSWASIEKFLINKVDLVFSANESRADIMFKEYRAKKRPMSLLNIPARFIGQNFKEKFISKDFLPNDERKIVLYQGMINEYRNIENLIMSSEYFNHDLVLVLIGKFSSNKYRDKIERLIKSGFNNNVVILDSVPQLELVSITQKAHIGIVIYDNCSKNNYLCAPNKLYEYASVGIPVAGSDFPEIRNVLTKYQIGELFSENTPNLIASSINKINQNYQRYSKEFQFAALFSDHNWKLEENKLLDCYNKL